MENTLTTGEQIEILSAVIFNFAQGQFEAHGVDPAVGKVIFDSARNRQMDLAFNQIVGSKMEPPTPTKTESKTGTVEDLKEEFNRFYGGKDGSDGDSE